MSQQPPSFHQDQVTPEIPDPTRTGELSRVSPTRVAWSLPRAEVIEATSEGPGFNPYLHALRRRWLLGLLISIPLAGAVTYLLWTYGSRKYTATAILQLAANEATLVFETADQKTTNNVNAFEIFKRTQRQLLTSRYVLTPALRDKSITRLPLLKNEPDPAAWLETNLRVDFPDESEIMHVSLSAGSPGGLDQIVNAIVKAYFDEVVNAERNRKLDRVNSLELAYKKAETELRAKRTELRQLVDRVGSGDSTTLTLVQQNSLQQFAAYQTRFVQVRFDLMQAQAELALDEQALKEEPDEDAVSEAELAMALKSDPQGALLTENKRRTKELMEKTRAEVRGKRAESIIEEYAKRMEGYDSQIEERKQELRAELLDTRKKSAEINGQDLRRNISLLQAQEEQLQKKCQEIESESKLIGRTSIDVEMMRAEAAALQEVLTRLGTELERTRIELLPDSKNSWTRVTLRSEAQPARSVDRKTRITQTAAFGVLSLFLPVFVLVWLDRRKERFNSRNDVAQALGMSVIGSVPRIPQRAMRRLQGPSTRDEYWWRRLSDSFDAIAAVLLHGAGSGGIRVVMVTSANAREGKTTLAGHLATSLASAGRKTILVDFDLRRPMLHQVFELNLRPGVCDVLHDPEKFDSAIQVTQIENLMFLSAGSWHASGLGGLAATDLQGLFQRLRNEFEFVVADGSPVLPVVDTRLVAKHVDAVVFSVLRDVSCAPQARAACRLLESFGVPLFGAVVTGSSEDVYGEYGPRPGEEPA